MYAIPLHEHLFNKCYICSQPEINHSNQSIGKIIIHLTHFLLKNVKQLNSKIFTNIQKTREIIQQNCYRNPCSCHQNKLIQKTGTEFQTEISATNQPCVNIPLKIADIVSYARSYRTIEPFPIKGTNMLDIYRCSYGTLL